ncbi:MAG: hypothetical protein VX726_09750 [Planctomycetota bacterium]|nr:hypothetical protein [Planctomycetota bacterium]MEE2896007.1 hypothetical protein [Planctomycetota bacterium]
MKKHPDTIRTPRGRRQGRLVALVLPALLALPACETATKDAQPVSVRAAEVRPVLVLPSPMVLDLASQSGLPVSPPSGRSDHRLGGAPIGTGGPSVAIVEVRDDQRIVNGRVYNQTRWRTRTGNVRSGR